MILSCMMSPNWIDMDLIDYYLVGKELAGTFWCPQHEKDKELLEQVQRMPQS